ncbi:hypothetical protein [Cellulomonas fimi]|uniref:Uncharacterized protein n=1 Tax=Cellulomonas fimi (strain ATCC 484 / DSM 20113 / JCM 1341 / CCUG 24087 / LMG 16345 / NBRC 15513 / NCIMB 8980 / NCTC 7547 / NRS-133) TaxID=590998 RepID=F4H6S4_CELFA|nr:hypothetical protein [Cellulomonas fimi]AEE46835.1 hypothetical protein Celf_2711 [Cellulomonas fimi ATCC 484]NNH06378.1 hypothetical protein [Cellulomonas fimi]VEH34317.1 ABC-2 family transporter protein [Cellulomonas fimi]
MRSLLRAELARAGARPFVWFVAAAVLLGVVGLVATGWWASRPPTAAQTAAADAAFADAMRVWEADADAVLETCRQVTAQEDPALSAAEVADRCATMVPVREAFDAWRPDAAILVAERLPSAGVMVLLGALLLGAGLVTAEFQSGAIGTWLTFAPRRGRVFVTKGAAALAVAVPTAAVALALLVLGLVVVAAVNGVPSQVPAEHWGRVAGEGARWVVAAAGTAALGVGLGFALRHAAAVTGVAVWWVAAVESALPLVLPAVRWLPLSTNLTAWATGEATYTVPDCVPDPTAPAGELCRDVLHTVGAGQGALVAGLLVAGALAAGWCAFRLRDV